jgi:hypothetical protein
MEILDSNFSLHGFNSNELQHKAIEIIQSENKKKRLKNITPSETERLLLKVTSSSTPTYT